MQHRIKVSGCDDSTIVDLDLTDEQVATVRMVAAAITAESQFSCMPRMKVDPDDEGDIE